MIILIIMFNFILWDDMQIIIFNFKIIFIESRIHWTQQILQKQIEISSRSCYRYRIIIKTRVVK